MKRANLKVLSMALMVGLIGCSKDDGDDAPAPSAPAETGLVVEEKQNAFLGYVGATWCPPCGAYGGPAYKHIKEQYTDNEIVPLYLAPSGATIAYSADASGLIVSPFLQEFYSAMKSSGSIPFFAT